MNRYQNTGLIRGRKAYGISKSANKIYWAAQSGNISVKRYIVKEKDRLDVLAGKHYRRSDLWWIIAAASGIGWSLQVPPGTVLFIPLDLSQVQMMM